MSDSDYQAALSRIIASANAIKDAQFLVSARGQVANADVLHGAWDNIYPTFLPVNNVVDILVDDGVSYPIAQKAADAIQHYLRTLQMELRTSFTKTWAEILHQPMDSVMPSLAMLRARVCEAYETIYNRKKLDWIEEARRFASARLTSLKVMSDENRGTKGISRSPRVERPVFNQAYVPILEACFAKNMTPSRADKMLLAENMGMSYKQINIWFQNRRSRTKKTSNTLKELGSGRATRYNSESSCLSSVIPRESSEDVHVSFAVNSPTYAFPARYPPEVEVDPFPSRFGDFSCLRNLDWPRRPTTKSQEEFEPDIEVLCVVFASLRIADAKRAVSQKGNKRVQKGREEPAKSACSDACPPFVVRPLRAPLFSLLRNVTCRAPECSEQPRLDKKERNGPVSTPSDANGSQTIMRKPRGRKCGGKDISSTSNGPVSVNCRLRKAGPADSQVRIKHSEKSSSSRHTTRASKSARRKGKDVSMQSAVQSSEQPPSRSSPTPSIESLPSLSYSSGSSSSSTYSQSPTSSFSTLSDDGYSPPHDAYQSTDYSLTLPTSQTAYDEYPSSTSAFDGFSFDLAKAPLDHSLDFGLPEYPSYSDTFDSLSQVLQLSSDFAPLLSLESPPLAS